MYKKTISYTDFEGTDRTETFWFNLTKAELAELQLTYPGGFAEYLQHIVDAQNQAEIVKMFKEILKMSYGEKDPTGRRFIKSKELTDEFLQTAAYSELFMLFATNEKEATAFINGIVPQIEEPNRQALAAAN